MGESGRIGEGKQVSVCDNALAKNVPQNLASKLGNLFQQSNTTIILAAKI